MTRNLVRLAALLAGGLSSASLAPAQTGDTCADPIPVTTSGVTYADFLEATASGSPGPGSSCGTVMDSIEADLFFVWTAPATGDFSLHGDAGHFFGFVSRSFAVYEGAGCGAPCLFSTTSDLDWFFHPLAPCVVSANAGDTYLLQVGVDTGHDPSLAWAEVEIESLSGAGCPSPDVFEPNDSVTDAVALTSGVYPQLSLCTKLDVFDYYRVRLEPGEAAFIDAVVTSGIAVEFEGVDPTGTIPAPWPLGNGQASWAEVANRGTVPEDYYFRVIQEVQGSTPSIYDLNIDIQDDGCLLLSSDVFEPNDTCGSARFIVPGFYPGMTMEAEGQDYFRTEVVPGARLRVDVSQAFDIEFLDGCSGLPLASSDTGLAEWTNAGTAPVDVSMHITSRASFPGQVTCQAYTLTVSLGDPVGANVTCHPIQPNSTGVSGGLRGEGFAVAGTGALSLIASDLPVGYASFVLGSRSIGNTPNLGGGAGTLCLGGSVLRFTSTLTNPGTSAVLYPLDINAFPEPPTFAVPVLPGESWYFQVWHRDALASGGTNLTSALFVTFN